MQGGGRGRGGKLALILVDHGSAVAEANAVVEAAAAIVRDERFVAVLAAHMELAPPTLADAFAGAVAAGAERIVVVPFFLGPGRHSRSDIPRLAAQASLANGGVTYVVAEPLGPDPALAALALARAEQALAATSEDG